MNSTCIDGVTPAQFDRQIVKALKLKSATDETLSAERMIAGVRNEAGELYRKIGATSPKEFMKMTEVLEDLGLRDELEMTTKRRHGCDLIFTQREELAFGKR